MTQQVISDHEETTSSIRIQYDEIELRELVKSSGGKWNREQKVWEIPSNKVEILGLKDRVVS